MREINDLPCSSFCKTHQPNRVSAERPAPPVEIERQVKQFAADGNSAQMPVHWLERGSATRALKLVVDGRAVADLVPGGLARVRLTPGAHVPSVTWGDDQAVLRVRGQAGTVQFAEVISRFGLWATGFAWEVPNRDGFRQRAALARVTADVDLQIRPETEGASVVAQP